MKVHTKVNKQIHSETISTTFAHEIDKMEPEANTPEDF